MHVFREARVIGGGEREIVAQREAARCQAQRTFGGDVQDVRIELPDHAIHPALRKQREAYLGIRGTGQRAEVERCEEPHLVFHRRQLAGGGLECADHAVDLRLPGIRDDEYLHG
jgi:hypothetical protein